MLNATADALVIVDLASDHVGRATRPRFHGLVPTAWYPDSVGVDGNRKRILVANDKGVDVYRAKIFRREFAQWERSGTIPEPSLPHTRS